MDTDEKANIHAPGFVSRLQSARWTLAAVLGFAALLIYIEPALLMFAMLGTMLVFAVAIVLPRNNSRDFRTPDSKPGNAIWLDNSVKAIAETLDYPVCIVDASAILRYTNRATETVFGASAIGDPVSVTFRRPEIARIIGEAISRQARLEIEYAEQIPRDRWFNLQIAPVPNSIGGDPEFYLLSFHDLTEPRRAEQMRSDFIANASHELRTPLASLRGFIETIKGPAAADAKATAQFLDIMLDQAERMSRLIDDLLSLSRLEMRSHLRPQDSVVVADVLTNVVNALEPLAQRLGVKIEKRLPSEKLEILGDRDELIQVFENLVENACKYGQSGGKVEIEAVVLQAAKPAGAPRVEISVSDHGPGIAEEHLPRLTERFYRVDVGSSRNKQGTGLGLAIVKHILNRHETRLGVTSNLGAGSRFSVVFPLQAAPASVEKR